MVTFLSLFLGLALPAAPALAASRVERATALLGPGWREETLGPWRLLTDVRDRSLVNELDRVAAFLPEEYRARFGLEADARPGETLVLFASEASYRTFTRDAADPVPIATSGHAGGGFASAHAGAGPGDARPAAVHELVHLLTEQAFAFPAPPWINEGLSEDLAWCRADSKGRLVFDTLDGRMTALRAGDRILRTESGPRTTVKNFRERWRSGRVPPLPALIAPARFLSADAGERRDAYTAAGLLVRFLLAGDPGRAARFRTFLREAAFGSLADLDALAFTLEMDSKTLEREYWGFVRGR